MKEDKPQRIRRTRNELRTAMLDAVMQLAKEKPLALITMVDVGERSGIRVDVLTRNFTNMERILSIYAASVDFWITDLFLGQHSSGNSGEKYYKEIYKKLVNAVYNDSDMQRLLEWEITEDNPSTRRMANSREEIYQNTIVNYTSQFKEAGLNMDILSAILTGGIYYLILRRKRSTFCGVDFNKRSERKRLVETVGQFADLIFDKLREHNRTVEIARRMKENGIADEVIVRCTELPAETVAGLE